MEKITFTKEHTYSGSLILVTPEFSLGRIRDRLSLQSIFPNPEMKAPFLPRVSSQPDILLEKQAAEALQGLLADIGCKDGSERGNIYPKVRSSTRTQRASKRICD